MSFLVVGGWAGVERYVTRDTLGNWELDDLRSAHRFETQSQAEEAAKLVHGFVLDESALRNEQ